MVRVVVAFWKHPGGPRAAAQLLLVLATFAALAAGWQIRRAHEAVRTELRQQSLAASAAGAVAGPAVPRDFTFGWPLYSDDAAVWVSVLAAAQRSNLRVLSVVSHAGTLQDAGVPSSDLTVELRGDYAAIKAWLDELATRRANLAIVLLDFRHAAGPAAPGAPLEATVRLRSFTRPASSRPS